VGEVRVNEEGKEGWMWSMYFIYLCEIGTMKLVAFILSGGGEWRRVMVWGEPNQGYI
jgi:hypothetical protein